MDSEVGSPREAAFPGSQELPTCGLLAAKHHASGRCSRDQSVLLVGYGALNIADRAAPLHHGSFRSESRLPDRAKEIDLQFDRSEGFLRREGARKRHSHRGVSNVTKNPAVQRPHGICVLWSGRQGDRGSSISNLFCFKPNQTCNRHVIRLCPRPKIEFPGHLLSTHLLPPAPSSAAHDPWFRGIPPDGGRQDRAAHPFAAADSPSSSLREIQGLTFRVHPRMEGPRD